MGITLMTVQFELHCLPSELHITLLIIKSSGSRSIIILPLLYLCEVIERFTLPETIIIHLRDFVNEVR